MLHVHGSIRIVLNAHPVNRKHLDKEVCEVRGNFPCCSHLPRACTFVVHRPKLSVLAGKWHDWSHFIGRNGGKKNYRNRCSFVSYLKM